MFAFFFCIMVSLVFCMFLVDNLGVVEFCLPFLCISTFVFSVHFFYGIGFAFFCRVCLFYVLLCHQN